MNPLWETLALASPRASSELFCQEGFLGDCGPEGPLSSPFLTDWGARQHPPDPGLGQIGTPSPCTSLWARGPAWTGSICPWAVFSWDGNLPWETGNSAKYQPGKDPPAALSASPVQCREVVSLPQPPHLPWRPQSQLCPSPCLGLVPRESSLAGPMTHVPLTD